jgi:VIT1/CCC1 family predicted Fe2+/Mn2+ transporter
MNFMEELETKMWKTKGARYNAYRRLRNKHLWSARTISVLSIYAITVSLLQLFPDIVAPEKQHIATVAAVSFAIFILVLSILEQSENYLLRAEHLHRCANEISKLYDELHLLVSGNREIEKNELELRRISDAYHDTISRYDENHDWIDYLYFQAEHPHVFKLPPWRANLNKIYARMVAYGLYFALIVLLPIVALYFLSK